MLAQLKEPLVQLRGRWVDVRPDQIERALAFIQKHQAGQMELAEALSTALAPTTLDGVARRHRRGQRLDRSPARGRPRGRPRRGRRRAAGLRRAAARLPEARRSLARHPPAATASARCSPTTWASAKRSRSTHRF